MIPASGPTAFWHFSAGCSSCLQRKFWTLLRLSLIHIFATADIFGEAEYQPEENRIAIQPDLSGAASFRALAREIVYAQIGTGMH